MRNKIVPLKELAEIVSTIKKEGKTVAQCHGCFDLMHLGHIKHFEAAKKSADILIVTVTQDQFVNKGPGRPVFNEMLRMEAIAALEAVDYVALNQWDTAIKTIKLVKPNLYIKGQEYKDTKSDITKNISLEEDAVISVGGSIYFTEEITFSSSNLINNHFSPLDTKTQEYLAGFKNKFPEDKVLNVIEELKDLKILVIGDTIIDEYHQCKPLGKSSKSPTISSIFLKSNEYAGGSLAIANHLDQFAGNVELITCLGKNNSQIDIINKKLSPSVKSSFFWREDGPTPTKRRYLDLYQNIKIFEITFMNDKYINKELEKQVIEHLENVINQYDLVLVADFGHGFISPGIIDFLKTSGKYLAINAQTNSNNFGFNYITKYKRADYISIDEKELRLPFGDNYGNIKDLIRKLYDISKAETINITLGEAGSIIYNNKKFHTTPAFATAVKDSVGAGDAVLSVTSLCAYNKVEPEIIGFIGNCVGALAVEIIGNERPVQKTDLMKFIKHFLK